MMRAQEFSSGEWIALRGYMALEHGHQTKATGSPKIPLETGFLERLASELKIGRHSAYRHAVQRALETVRKNYQSGQYRSTTEAELMLRKLVESDDTCE
jgi:hypothetical protein